MSETVAASSARGGTAGTPGAGRWWILAALSLVQLILVLDSTVMNVALPSTQANLGFTDADRQWVITAYALAFGGLLLVGGRLSDTLGRKRMLLVAMGGFVGASLLGGLASGFVMLVVARALQGVFGALLAPATLSLLATTFTESSARGKAFGVFGAVSSSGSVLGLLVGGALTEYLDWRWCLLVNVALGVIIVAAAAVLLPADERGQARTHSDPLGVFASVFGVFAVVYGFSAAEHSSWTSTVTVGSIALGVVLLALFVFVETRVAHPVLPMGVVLDRNRGGAYLMVAIAGIGMFGVFLFLTYHLQQVLGFTPLATGVAFVPMIGLLVIGSIVAGGVLLPRMGPRVIVITGLLLAASGTALFTGLTSDSGYAGGILPGLIITGAGFGLVFGPAMNLATHGVAPAQSGAASAMVNAGQQLGAAVGTALLNTIAVSGAAGYLAGQPRTPDLATQATIHGNRVAFWVTAGVFTAGAILCGLIIRPGRDLGTTTNDNTPAPAA
ncbi:MFS transporter [Amycolatopsis vastitatis]|uniref:MFS transporter n=1 Tax=Amycolatopsis vastitatis TaxID=1905142 RepID=A0A229SL15_9PSEU|nr:MFS transporter [Amycolatopsis vastitatis]OXM59331.1 MFS transporter [Amycolatopsis vastitatis]